MPTVLVVEDEPGIRHLLTTALTRAGIDVAGAADGLEALQILNNAATPCRLVLLDLLMPRFDGRAFLEAIESDANRPMIILVTAAVGFEDIPQGVDLVIKKPFDVAVVTATVVKALQSGFTPGSTPGVIRPEPELS